MRGSVKFIVTILSAGIFVSIFSVIRTRTFNEREIKLQKLALFIVGSPLPERSDKTISANSRTRAEMLKVRQRYGPVESYRIVGRDYSLIHKMINVQIKTVRNGKFFREQAWCNARGLVYSYSAVPSK